MEDYEQDRDEAQRIGAIITRLRKESGLTLDQVGDRTGFTKSHVWALEKGRGRDITVRAVRAMAACFGVPMTIFFRDEGELQPLHPEAVKIAFQVDEAIRRASVQGQG